MLRHKYSAFIFFVLLAILFFTKASMFFYVILFIAFLAITTWGTFDIRLSYFANAICKKKSIQRKAIAITFDDGPHEKTSEVLDVLSKFKAKGTFFCIGQQIEKHPEILKRIIAEGHVVGNHSYSHSNKNGFFSTQKIVSEIEQTNTMIFQFINNKPKLYRPPFGVTNPNIARAVAKTNQVIIGWNIRSLDTVIENENTILERIKNKVKPGAIILLHDTSAKTVSVLEQLLLFLQSESYEMVTVDDLLEIPAYEN
jgi:peptidoglycan/xylan/chitin deacetylase (PgdA/CDA1 family)